MGTLASARHGTLSELAQPSGTPHPHGGYTRVLVVPEARALCCTDSERSDLETADVKPGQFTEQRGWGVVASPRRAVTWRQQFQVPVLCFHK